MDRTAQPRPERDERRYGEIVHFTDHALVARARRAFYATGRDVVEVRVGRAA